MVIITKFSIYSFFFYGGYFLLTNAQGLLNQALYLGDQTSFNSTRDDCIWKRGNDRDVCPDEDINVYLYTNNSKIKTWFDVTQTDWLRNSGWDANKENIILIHGYAGGDDTLPISVLRDAYIKQGGFNLFMVDWGGLCQPPCYVAAVHNIKSVAYCLANNFNVLRDAGLTVEKLTCVGHSLGAHVCGLMSNFMNFRLERIIALDPARPLMKKGNQNRLDSGDAKSVQVVHTNAGYYGEGGRVGHVDFCVNGGRRQPYCGATININLCSHIWSVCYLAQSIFIGQEPMAEPCHRKCPSGVILAPARQARKRFGFADGYAIPMGQRTPLNAVGSYCVKDEHPPYCPATTTGGIGDKRCCLAAAEWEGL